MLFFPSKVMLQQTNQHNVVSARKHLSKSSYYRTRVQSLATLVTHSLTPRHLVDLIVVTLACDDANSKLVEVVTVADVDAMKRVDDSLEAEVWS